MGDEIDVSGGPSAAALEVLRRTVVTENNRISLPIDVDRVAQRLGLDVERMPLDGDVDGMLVRPRPYEHFKAVIDINAPMHRARFTLAH